MQERTKNGEGEGTGNEKRGKKTFKRKRGTRTDGHREITRKEEMNERKKERKRERKRERDSEHEREGMARKNAGKEKWGLRGKRQENRIAMRASEGIKREEGLG